jgi:hypothetical protein
MNVSRQMNHTPHLDAALTALTVLGDYLHPGCTASPGRLLTAAEMSCERHGLPEDQAPAITAIASFWVALASGCPPAGPGRDAADWNLAGLPGYPWQQAEALRLAAQMLRDWLGYLPAATAPQPASDPDDDDDDLDYPGPDPVILTRASSSRHRQLLYGFLNAYASRPARRRLLRAFRSRRQRPRPLAP